MKPNPITVEVVRNAINAYADEMATALCKSAYNMMIYEVRDFCCGLIDHEGRMISQNKGGLPIFLADLGIAVKDGIARYGLDGFAPGDVVIMNYALVCGQHLNNVVIYAPCFHDGEVVGFAASRAHWVDIGGMRIGFGSVETTEIYQEGLQFRSLKIYEAGKRNDTLWQIINDNLRFPEAALGDLRAQVACCQLGVRRYGELLARYGRGTVAACIAAVWDVTDDAVRGFVAKIPDGSYEAESFLDNDGRTLDVKLRIKVKVVVDGDRMVVDFSGMNEQVPGPTNSGYSGGLAAARVAFKNLTQGDAPVNEGSFRALELILPEGKILNARWPAALGLWSIPLPTVIDTILKALAPALPARIPAAHKGDMGGCSIGGFRPDGRRFLLMNIFGGGWGGRPHEDGESASVSICQGDVRSAPIELQEIQYPFLIERFALRTDSGGAGEHRGGLGVDLTYRALQKCVANVNSERTKDPPWGLAGGRPGAVNEAVLVRCDGDEQKLDKATGVELAPGDRLTFRTAGGGGWGEPRRRDGDAIERDIAAGYVSPAAALRDYGYEPVRAKSHPNPTLTLLRPTAGLPASGPLNDEVTKPRQAGVMVGEGKGGGRRGGIGEAMLAEERRRRLLAAMAAAGIEHMVLYGNAWQGDYLRYAADFGILEGHGIAVVSSDGTTELFLDSATDAERAEAETAGVHVQFAADIIRAVGARLDPVANHSLAAAPRRFVPSWLADDRRSFALEDATALLDRLLMHKLPAEIALLRRAAAIADEAYAEFRAAVTPGRRQYELVADVEAYLRGRGCPDNFMIIGSGGRDVLGMTPPSERRIAPGDLVTTELTPAVEGYFVQICRTLVVGRASEAQRRAFDVFHEALEAGIGAVRPGAVAADVARAENDVFRRYGLGEYTTSKWTRVRGHGLGLFCDSKPHLLEDVETPLVPGMALIVHPNTYHPDAGYIVLGDAVVVTETGAEVLCKTPRQLFEVAA